MKNIHFVFLCIFGGKWLVDRSLHEQKAVRRQFIYWCAFQTMRSLSLLMLQIGIGYWLHLQTSTMFNFLVLHRTQWPPAPGSKESAAGNL